MTRPRLNVFSLFAGIGGLELGLERAGMRVVGQVEIDGYCRQVLAKHWPDVPRHDDVRTAVDWWTSERRPRVDVVCGGFPCTPFSDAGLRRGTADERWGWPWFADVLRVVRPRYVLVENVPNLLRWDGGTAFGIILADLDSLGFDAEWSVLSACAMGAPHMRRRLFVLAYPPVDDVQGALPHDPRPAPLYRHEPRGSDRRAWRDWWVREPAVDRVAYGDARSVVYDELHALGNAVVPQVAEYVGRLIVEHAESLEGAA
jgi:DNA (cytosine-5)-methyltransferase 1